MVCSLEELAVNLGAKGIFESQQREGDTLKHTTKLYSHFQIDVQPTVSSHYFQGRALF